MRRWTDAHIPIVAKPGRYEQLARDLDAAISDAGIDVTARAAPIGPRAPRTRVWRLSPAPTFAACSPTSSSASWESDVEVLIYPSDVAIAGTKLMVARVQAALASRLTTAQAWLTATAEGQRIEDRLARHRRRDSRPGRTALPPSPGSIGSSPPRSCRTRSGRSCTVSGSRWSATSWLGIEPGEGLPGLEQQRSGRRVTDPGCDTSDLRTARAPRSAMLAIDVVLLHRRA